MDGCNIVEYEFLLFQTKNEKDMNTVLAVYSAWAVKDKGRAKLGTQNILLRQPIRYMYCTVCSKFWE